MYKSFSVSQLWCGAWLRLFQWHFLSLIRRFSTQHTRVERFLSIYIFFLLFSAFSALRRFPVDFDLCWRLRHIFFNLTGFSTSKNSVVRVSLYKFATYKLCITARRPTKSKKKTLKLIWNNKRHSTLAAWAKSQLLPNAADFIYIFRLIHCRHRPVSWGFFKVQPCRPAVNCVNLRRSGFIISSHVVSV